MVSKFNEFVVCKDSTIAEALTKIDQNKQGFVIVTNSQMEVHGVLTDGDVNI